MSTTSSDSSNSVTVSIDNNDRDRDLIEMSSSDLPENHTQSATVQNLRIQGVTTDSVATNTDSVVTNTDSVATDRGVSRTGQFSLARSSNMANLNETDASTSNSNNLFEHMMGQFFSQLTQSNPELKSLTNSDNTLKESTLNTKQSDRETNASASDSNNPFGHMIEQLSSQLTQSKPELKLLANFGNNALKESTLKSDDMNLLMRAFNVPQAETKMNETSPCGNLKEEGEMLYGTKEHHEIDKAENNLTNILESPSFKKMVMANSDSDEKSNQATKINLVATILNLFMDYFIEKDESRTYLDLGTKMVKLYINNGGLAIWEALKDAAPYLVLVCIILLVLFSRYEKTSMVQSQPRPERIRPMLERVSTSFTESDLEILGGLGIVERRLSSGECVFIRQSDCQILDLDRVLGLLRERRGPNRSRFSAPMFHSQPRSRSYSFQTDQQRRIASDDVKYGPKTDYQDRDGWLFEAIKRGFPTQSRVQSRQEPRTTGYPCTNRRTPVYNRPPRGYFEDRRLSNLDLHDPRVEVYVLPMDF